MNTQSIHSVPEQMNRLVEHYAPECSVVVEEFYEVDAGKDMTWKLTGSWATVTDLVRKLSMEGIRAQIHRSDDLCKPMTFWLVI